MIRIHWKSKLTGQEGHGSWRPTAERAVLQEWINSIEKDQSQMLSHRIEDDGSAEQLPE